ncbi:MAG: 50S ribosomal protein L23 [Pantoea sp. Brub]|nr:50S ribosomal protein L23 [Pantoea sp. Brub]
MIYKERLLKIIHSAHVSEKSSNIVKEHNTFTIKVAKNSTKKEIKDSIQMLFEVNVKKINTLIIKGKIKRRKNHNSYSKNWKKAYITLAQGQTLKFINGAE